MVYVHVNRNLFYLSRSQREQFGGSEEHIIVWQVVPAWNPNLHVFNPTGIHARGFQSS